MADKLDAYADVIERLTRETIACTPGSWNDGRLSIQCDGLRLTYQLKNGHVPEKAVLSETLRDLIDELYVRMEAAGDAWSAAELEFSIADSEVKFDVAFEYNRSAPVLN